MGIEELEKVKLEKKPSRQGAQRGRPKGGHNRPDSKKVGRKPGRSKLPQMSSAEMVDAKYRVLDIMQRGMAKTIADAARIAGFEPHLVYKWAFDDKDFLQMMKLTREIVADDLESKLQRHGNFIPLMFLLKAYRPMFRDNYKIDIGTDKMEELLSELREAGSRKVPKIEVTKVEENETTTVIPFVGEVCPSEEIKETI